MSTKKQKKTTKPVNQLWALKSPSGELDWTTIACVPSDENNYEGEVWSRGGYESVAEKQGSAWARRYWKRWDESIASAKRLGWTFVRVELVEA